MSTIDTCSAVVPATTVGKDTPVGRLIGQFVMTLVESVERMADRRRSRRALLEMSDLQLKDIGISRADAEREGLRQPWR